MAKARALGKGLGALFTPPAEAPTLSGRGQGEITSLPVDNIRPNPAQPRRDMDEASLDSLAESIRSHGVVQPLIVRALEEDGIFEIVAGERRWRAARSAGLPRVPVRVIEGSDRELREISLVENIQREDLSPLEIASAISELIQQHSLTQEEVAERIGWSRAAVTNKLRLLQLPEEVRNMLSESLLSEGHCRALLSVDSPSMMIALARTAEERGMSVRQLEEAVRRSKLQVPEVSSAKRASFVIPEPVQSSLRGQGISLKVTGNPNRMKVSLDGLNRSQMEAFVRFLEERGEELFPGK